MQTLPNALVGGVGIVAEALIINTMNQNTREVEDIVDELSSLAWQDGSEGLNRRSALNERFQSAIHHQLQKAREEERERISLLVDSLSISTGAPERAMEYKAAWQFGNDVLENAKRKLLKAINK